MTKKQFNKKSQTFFMVSLLIIVFTALVATSVIALDTVRPTILYVTPTNNEMDLSRNELMSVVFSEDMDPSSINQNTVIMMQRTTPQVGNYRSLAIIGTLVYSNRKATFITDELLSPSQRFGNVFTVTLTKDIKDLSGNALSRDYVWSFTTGADPFNTSGSTSKLNQSAALVILVPVVNISNQTTIITAPTANEETDDNAGLLAGVSPWMWIVGGGLLLLLLLATIYGLAMRSSSSKKTEDARPNPFCNVQPVIDLEGIGLEYNKALLAMGIKNTKQLWEADARRVARVTGAPLILVKSWQHMAELSSVNDIGPQYAELLERSGVHNIDQLKGYDTNELLSIVRKKQNSLKINIQGNSPGHAMVEHWIGEARSHKFCGFVGHNV
ncbi:MAG: DUF4332 domain-containing protein [archaeon]